MNRKVLKRKQKLEIGGSQMDFNLSKEHLMLQQMYNEFTEKEVKPLAEEVDEKEEFPVDTLKKLKRYGFMGIPFPKEFGGQGGDVLAYAMAIETLSKACATTGVIVSAHTSLCAAPIYEFGTQEQKEKYLIRSSVFKLAPCGDPNTSSIPPHTAFDLRSF